MSRDDVMTTCFTQLSHKKKEEVSCDQTEGERKQVAPIFSFVSFPRLLSSFPSLSFASLSTPMTDKSFSSGGQTFRTRIGNLLLKNTPPPPSYAPPLTQPTSYPNTTFIYDPLIHFHLHYYSPPLLHLPSITLRTLRSDCFHLERSNTAQRAYLRTRYLCPRMRWTSAPRTYPCYRVPTATLLSRRVFI